MTKKRIDASKTIRVVLADDHEILREGLTSLLREERDIDVVGHAATGTEAVELADRLKPDIIVMDITMPKLNGLQATEQIRLKHPSIGVIILSMSAHDQFVMHALRAGVRAYLVKETAAHELITAIREVRAGRAYFSPAISGAIVDHFGGASRDKALTSKEHEVLCLIARGKTNREIGDLLCISAKTVDIHRQQIMRKLDVHNAASLARYAVEKGLVK